MYTNENMSYVQSEYLNGSSFPDEQSLTLFCNKIGTKISGI